MNGYPPSQIPIFPLGQAILLPRGRLPLNIFEPRYLAMTDDALRGDRTIGMIQPLAEGDALHKVGCAGRLISWEETGDGRFHIALYGMCRFRIVDEIASSRPYRQVRADYLDFPEDLTPSPAEIALDRPALFANLQRFLSGQQLEANWDAIAEAPAEALINTLSMICPFGIAEKQALVEAPTVAERARILVALVEMATVGTGGTRLQ